MRKLYKELFICTTKTPDATGQGMVVILQIFYGFKSTFCTVTDEAGKAAEKQIGNT